MKYSNYRVIENTSYEQGSSLRELQLELSASELDELASCAKFVAYQAAEVVLDIYSSSADIKVQLKADQTPVTKADLASDQRIITELKKNTSFPIITEEHPLDFVDRKDRKLVWLVDPLDGTQNFVNRDGQFSILISLLYQGSPIVGVVSVPALNEMYFGYYRGGAYLETERGTEQEKSTQITHPHQSRKLKAVLSSLPSVGGKQREEEFCVANDIEAEQIFRLGSSLKLAHLARGDYDLTARFDVLSEWDTAAADCLLAEANCQLRDVITNEPIQYNARETLGLSGYTVLRSDYQFQEIKS